MKCFVVTQIKVKKEGETNYRGGKKGEKERRYRYERDETRRHKMNDNR
jgi:hypothetical protein